MRWPRRGVLIRLIIYVPLISFLAWRAQGSCSEQARMEPESELDQKLAPHRRVITLPDGTQQQIVEMTPEEAEAILGHPIPNLDRGKAEPEPKPEPGTEPEPKPEPGTEPEPKPEPGTEPESGSDRDVDPAADRGADASARDAPGPASP